MAVALPFALTQWCEVDGVDIERFAKIARHRQVMSENPVVKKVIAAETAAT